MTLGDLLRETSIEPPLTTGLEAARAGWLRRYARFLVALDATILLAVGLLALFVRFGSAAGSIDVRGVGYFAASLLLIPVWLATLSLSRCYETRFVGNGAEEFKRVANASFRVVAVVGLTAFMTKTQLSRGFVSLALSGGLLGVVAGRYAARVWLHRQRMRGQCVHRVIVVGDASHALEMTTSLARHPFAGLQVVGACVAGESGAFSRQSLIPVLGSPKDLLPALERLEADTVVIAKGPGLTQEELRQLSYELEGTGIDLCVSPSFTNVTGSRISYRTLPGLPLLHVEEPELTGSRRLVKATFDRSVAASGLLLILPLLFALAVAIRLTSSGPSLYRQERVGRAGKRFTIWKLRTMYVGAHANRPTLTADNVHGSEGVLFKMAADPRVTAVGRFLRRYSLDELPQLMNVVLGDMSLVGPRPPLQEEVDRYEGHVHRRLLVKPGMTGLWQVSGRADLPWEESVRLDLHYVENWSLGLDVAVICKTILAVLKPRGAY